MKRTVVSLVLLISLLLGCAVYADEEKLTVNVTPSSDYVYEGCTESFKASVSGSPVSGVQYSWYISTKSAAAGKSEKDNGYYPMAETYFWAEGTDSDELWITVPRGFYTRYSGDNSIVFRCKVVSRGKAYYSDDIPLVIRENPYEAALAFDEKLQTPIFTGNRSSIEITPCSGYVVEFSAKELSDRFPSDLYTIRSGIRVNGELVSESEDGTSTLVRDFESGRYLVTEELYLYSNGSKLATARKELAINVQDSCSHNWAVVFDDATCEHGGTAYYCCQNWNRSANDICGAVISSQSAPLEEHDWQVIEETPASCTEDGRKVSVCPVCGKIETEVLPALGHQLVETRFRDDATGEEYTEIKCTLCGYVEEVIIETDPDADEDEGDLAEDPGEETTPADPEALDPSEDEQPSENTQAGESEGDEEPVSDEKTCEHKWIQSEEAYQPADCCNEGKRVFICSECSESIEVTVPKAPHVPGAWIDDTTGDCTSTGKRHIECTACGALLVSENLPADHRWVMTDVLYPTCTEEGSVPWTCSRCGATEATPAKAEGHDIVHVDGIEGNCITETVKDHYECTKCGAVFADPEGKKELDRNDVYPGFDLLNHIGGKYSHDGNSHYILCACLTKLDETRHRFSKGVCKVCGYEKGSMDEKGLSFVDIICEKMNVSPSVFWIICAAILVVGMLSAVLIGTQSASQKDGNGAPDVEDVPDVDTGIVDVDDAVIIDWGDEETDL